MIRKPRPSRRVDEQNAFELKAPEAVMARPIAAPEAAVERRLALCSRVVLPSETLDAVGFDESVGAINCVSPPDAEAVGLLLIEPRLPVSVAMFVDRPVANAAREV